MSDIDPKDPKFTLRLGRALFHLSRGRSIGAVTNLTGNPRADIELWLATFNGGRPTLTEERIEEVKREVGVVVVRRVTDAEREEARQRKAARQTDEAQIAADKARDEAALIERQALEKRTRTKAPAKRQAKPVAATDVHNSPDTTSMPWRKIGTGWILKTVAAWRSHLEEVAGGTPVDVLLRLLSRETKIGFCTMRLRYFGAPEKLTAEAAADLLAFVQKVEDARVAIKTPRIRSREAAPQASEAVLQALDAARAALANLERAIHAERRAA